MTQQQNDLRAALYHKYLPAPSAAPFEPQIMPYEWSQLPNSLHPTWMAYHQMFQEYSCDRPHIPRLPLELERPPSTGGGHHEQPDAEARNQQDRAEPRRTRERFG